MKIKPTKGVVLVKVCNTYLLVPGMSISEVCPGIASLNGIETILWKRIEKGSSYDELLALISRFTMKSCSKATMILDSIINKLYKQGFIIKELD